MKEIKLTKGYVAIVDDEDFINLNKHKWRAQCTRNSVYAMGTIVINDKKNQILMHRFILSVSDKKLIVDHKNHDTLDNTRKNLRICTHQENTRNTSRRKGSRSEYLGVTLWQCKRAKSVKWNASIKLNGKRIYIGVFDSEIEAAKAYDKKAKELFGEFANPNFK